MIGTLCHAVLHRHYHYEQPRLSGYDFSMNTPCPHRRTGVFFLLVFVHSPPPPPFVTDMNPSLFLIQEVKGVGEGVTDITQEGNLCPVNCQFCRNCNTTRWWQNIQDDVLL